MCVIIKCDKCVSNVFISRESDCVVVLQNFRLQRFEIHIYKEALVQFGNAFIPLTYFSLLFQLNPAEIITIFTRWQIVHCRSAPNYSHIIENRKQMLHMRNIPLQLLDYCRSKMQPAHSLDYHTFSPRTYCEFPDIVITPKPHKPNRKPTLFVNEIIQSSWKYTVVNSSIALLDYPPPTFRSVSFPRKKSPSEFSGCGPRCFFSRENCLANVPVVRHWINSQKIVLSGRIYRYGFVRSALLRICESFAVPNKYRVVIEFRIEDFFLWIAHVIHGPYNRLMWFSWSGKTGGIYFVSQIDQTDPLVFRPSSFYLCFFYSCCFSVSVVDLLVSN